MLKGEYTELIKNSLMNARLFMLILFMFQTCVNTHRDGTTLKQHAYNEIYSGNSMNALHMFYGSIDLIDDRKVLPLLNTLIRRLCCPTDAKSSDSWIGHHVSSIFSSHSEAIASEWLENIEEMFPTYW